jgi:hypothetical protein
VWRQHPACNEGKHVSRPMPLLLKACTNRQLKQIQACLHGMATHRLAGTRTNKNIKGPIVQTSTRCLGT